MTGILSILDGYYRARKCSQLLKKVNFTRRKESYYVFSGFSKHNICCDDKLFCSLKIHKSKSTCRLFEEKMNDNKKGNISKY